MHRSETMAISSIPGKLARTQTVEFSLPTQPNRRPRTERILTADLNADVMSPIEDHSEILFLLLSRSLGMIRECIAPSFFLMGGGLHAVNHARDPWSYLQPQLD